LLEVAHPPQMTVEIYPARRKCWRPGQWRRADDDDDGCH
jgi:hypothetical protein